MFEFRSEDVPQKAFPRNDIGNGKRFAAMHRPYLRYCLDRKTWLHFDGKRWRKCFGNETERLAKNTVEQMIDDAGSVKSEHEREALLKHAAATSRRAKRETMVKDAISEPDMSVRTQDFDKDPYLLNVLNGTVNLRTGEIRPPNPDDLITKLAPVVCDPKAPCPHFQSFLLKTFEGDIDLIDCVQRILGYSITGDTSEQKVFIGHGSGANGKSTLFQAVKSSLGDYAIETEPTTIMVQRFNRIPTDIADLHNVRFAMTSESNDTQRLDEAKIKKMTGGEDLTGERKFEHPFKFTPQFKLILATNHLPVIRETDHAIWRRIIIIPFNARFWAPGDNEHGPRQMRIDPHFSEKLKAERSGILNWLLEGCLKWQQSGLTIPESIKSMGSEYRQEQDVLGRFIKDACFSGKEFHTRSKDLYAAFTKWLEEEGEETVTSTMLGKQLRERGMISKRTASERAWHGIGLRQQCEQ